MSVNGVNNTGKTQATEMGLFKPNMKKADAKTSAQKSIFSALDKNNDGVLSKSELQNATVKGKVKNAKGQLVEKEYIKIQDLPNGRSLVMDKNGKEWVRAKDGVILSQQYGNAVKDGKAPATQTNKSLTKTTNFLAKQYNSANKAFQAQMEKDGWAADLADGISRTWTWATDSKNSANYVREDLQTSKKNIQELQKAAKQGEAQFKAKFKQIYGVDYNQKAIDAYMAEPSENNYKKAFGNKVKDIKSRVDNYNQSQDTGATAVKTTGKIAAGVVIGAATGGAGLVALGAAAAGTAAASVMIEETDALKVTDAVTKGEVNFREGTDHGKILKDAAWDGASVAAGGGVAKAAGALIKGAGKLAMAGRVSANVTGDVALGAAREYAETGEVTTEGVITNAAMSAVGGAVVSGATQAIGKGVKSIKNAVNSSSTPNTKTATPASAERTFVASNGKTYKVKSRPTAATTSTSTPATPKKRYVLGDETPAATPASSERTLVASNGKTYKVKSRVKAATTSTSTPATPKKSSVIGDEIPKSNVGAPKPHPEVNTPKSNVGAPKPHPEVNTPKSNVETPKPHSEINTPKSDVKNNTPTSTPVAKPKKPLTKAEISDELDNVVSAQRAKTAPIKQKYDKEIERLETELSGLRRPNTSDKIKQLGDDVSKLTHEAASYKQNISAYQDKAAKLEQELLLKQSTLKKMEKSLQTYDRTNGTYGSNVSDDLSHISAETKAGIEDTFGKYGITDGSKNKASVIDDFRKEIQALQKDLANTNSIIKSNREFLETAESQMKKLRAEIKTEEGLRDTYLQTKRDLENQIGSTKQAKEKALSDLRKTPEFVELSAKFKNLQQQLREFPA